MAAHKSRLTLLLVKAGACAIAVGLLIISRTAAAQNGASHPPAPDGLEQEIKRVEGEVDRIFADTLAQLPSIPLDAAHRMKRVQTLGKLELFDEQLSVNRNEACSFCHMPYVDFTGPIPMLNLTTVAYPGSVRNQSADPAVSRYGHRKPQSYTYSTYFPPLQYNQTQGDFYGGECFFLLLTVSFLPDPSARRLAILPTCSNPPTFP